MLKIVRNFFEIDVGGGLNCAKACSNDLFFWISSVHRAKYGQMHAAVTIVAADNYAPPESRREDKFRQIIAEMYILLFLRRHAHRSPPAYATINKYFFLLTS